MNILLSIACSITGDNLGAILVTIPLDHPAADTLFQTFVVGQEDVDSMEHGRFYTPAEMRDLGYTTNRDTQESTHHEG